jgi:large repetitive protein
MLVRRPVRLAVLLTAALALVGASPAVAARPASVTVTSPANGSSGPAEVLVSGKATLPANTTLRLVVSTLGSSIALRPDAKGAWSTRLTDLVLGPTSICAEVYDSGGGYVTGACTQYTVLPTPARFTVASPTEGAEVNTPLTVTGSCEYDEIINVTTDVGVETSTECDFYTRDWSVTLPGLPAGPVTVTATALGHDYAPVATRVVHVTVVPLAAPTVQIADPVAGQTLYVDRVATVSGTAAGTEGVQVDVDGVGVGYSLVEADGAWSIVFFPDSAGDARVCATGTNADGSTTDCVDVVVSPDPDLFGLGSPADGLVTSSADIEVSGSCARDTEVEVGSDATATTATVPCENGGFTTSLPGLPDGTWTVTATMTYGGSPVASRSATVTVDTTGPATPVVTSPAAGATLTSLPVTLSGRAEPGSTVQVLHADQIAYAETTADASGAWSVVLARDYFEYEGVLTGRRAQVGVTVWALDAVGNTSPATTVTYTTRLR